MSLPVQALESCLDHHRPHPFPLFPTKGSGYATKLMLTVKIQLCCKVNSLTMMGDCLWPSWSENNKPYKHKCQYTLNGPLKSLWNQIIGSSRSMKRTVWRESWWKKKWPTSFRWHNCCTSKGRSFRKGQDSSWAALERDNEGHWKSFGYSQRCHHAQLNDFLVSTPNALF